MCIVCIANNINRNVHMFLNTGIFPTTGYTRVLLFMFIRRELEGTRTGCLFQFTYCVRGQAANIQESPKELRRYLQMSQNNNSSVTIYYTSTIL